jgi:RecA/RadA recombinase
MKLRRRAAKEVEELADSPPQPNKDKITSVKRRDLLSTGSTLLNLAFSDNPFGGLLKGKYYFFVGDSASGKTFLSMTCFAEATINKQFRNYRLIYDNVEDGCLMDVQGLFGKAVAKRLEYPGGVDKEGVPVFSHTIEEFYYYLDDAIKTGQPFIYVLDSMDALSSEYEGKKFDQHKKAFVKKRKRGQQAEKDTDADQKEDKLTGSYGDGKAKKNSENIRKVLRGVRETGSILIVLSQTRDSFNMGPGERKTRAGGRSLRFYATVEVWSSVVGQISKTVRGTKRSIGVNVGLKVKKNRITGKTYKVETDIYPSYGIDDVGTCVDYLVEEKHWATEKQSIVAHDFEVTATREKLIRVIEEQGLENQLRSLVGKVWREIEDSSKPQRKSRY